MSGTRSTEAVLAEARELDRQSTAQILATIHAQDAVALAAVGRVLPEIERAVEVLTAVLAGGGTWYNVGAGTSGRMGALDAAELLPTFGLSPRRVQAVIAGGERALLRAVEDAEDSAGAASFELRERGLSTGDAVVAISASGQTPFTLGSLEAAHEVGARTVAITCNKDSDLACAAEIAIVPETGPEVVAGSTRMKGGLAQKMVLHLLSTTTMVKLGYVEGNRMIHLQPNSAKLRERGVGIVMELAGVDRERALSLLRQTGGQVQEALALARRGR